MKLKTLGCLLLAIAATPCHADDDCIQRTWDGAIGNIPVMLTFTGLLDNYVPMAGTAYYRNSLQDLMLIPVEDQPGHWKELDLNDKVTGYLTLACEDGKRLRGEWRSVDGARRLPLKAQEADDYAARRHAGLPLQLAAARGGKQQRYEIVQVRGLPKAGAVLLSGTGPGIARINQAQQERLLDELDELLACAAAGRLSSQQQPFDNEFRSDVVAWSADVVAIEHTRSSYCGEAHPHFHQGVRTYDVQTGKVEDVSAWLGTPETTPAALKEYPDGWALEHLIWAAYADNGKACREAVSLDINADTVWPTTTGLNFMPTANSYPMQYCASPVIVSYKKLWPLLSEQGKRRARAMMKSPAPH